jgi:hypothetical protein
MSVTFETNIPDRNLVLMSEWDIVVLRQMSNFQLYHGENKLNSMR